MKSDEPAPHRIGKKNEEGPIYGKRAVRGAERRIRLPALCARLAAGGPDAGPLSRRPCRGGDGCRHARRRSERRRAERRADAPGRAGGPLLHGHGGAGVAGGAAGLHPRGARRPEDLSFPRAARTDGGGAADVPRHRVGRGEARPASSRRSLSHHGRALLPRDLLSSAALRRLLRRAAGAVSRGGLRRLQLSPRLAGNARPLLTAAPAGVFAGRIPPRERHAVPAFGRDSKGGKGRGLSLLFLFVLIPSK